MGMQRLRLNKVSFFHALLSLLLLLSVLWIVKHGFNPGLISSSDYVLRYSESRMQSDGQKNGKPIGSSHLWTHRYVPPRCESSAAKWQCGCKRMNVSGALKSERIDYSVRKKSESIPKVVHFLSRMFTEEKTGSGIGSGSPRWCGDVPCEYEAYMNKYLETLGGWEFHLHCRNEIAVLLQRHSPSLWTIYNSLSADIQRSDTARYIVLYYFGGLYSDMDVEPKVDLSPLLSNHSESRLVLGVEANMDWPALAEQMRRMKEDCAQADPESLLARVCANCSAAIENESLAQLMGCIHPIRKGRPEQNIRVANFWMMSIAGHRFWKDILELVQRRSRLPLQEQYDVLYTTGPDIVSEIYNVHAKVEEEEGIMLLEHDVLLGLNEHWTTTNHTWRKTYNSELCDELGFC